MEIVFLTHQRQTFDLPFQKPRRFHFTNLTALISPLQLPKHHQVLTPKNRQDVQIRPLQVQMLQHQRHQPQKRPPIHTDPPKPPKKKNKCTRIRKGEDPESGTQRCAFNNPFADPIFADEMCDPCKEKERREGEERQRKEQQKPGYEQIGYGEMGYEQPSYEQSGYEQPGYESQNRSSAERDEGRSEVGRGRPDMREVRYRSRERQREESPKFSEPRRRFRSDFEEENIGESSSHKRQRTH
ncbi:hypothetical protein B0J14DRAFT_650347 [Halenospora varia]|nr:hypothetical protein B0J14DRAFT_650347 [Halenospora varia]